MYIYTYYIQIYRYTYIHAYIMYVCIYMLTSSLQCTASMNNGDANSSFFVHHPSKSEMSALLQRKP